MEPASKKTKWKAILAAIIKKGWRKKYTRQAAPAVDKEALLKDRETLTTVQRLALGIQFVQDEQFYIRPDAASAGDTAVREEAA